jgi:hypothetical protein
LIGKGGEVLSGMFEDPVHLSPEWRNSPVRKSRLKPGWTGFMSSALKGGVKKIRAVRFGGMMKGIFICSDPLEDVRMLCLFFPLEILFDAK